MSINKIFYQQILDSIYQTRKENNPQYSLRKFAKDLEMDHTTLYYILTGKTIPSLKMAERLVGLLSLSSEEINLFLLSVIDAKQQRLLERVQRFTNLHQLSDQNSAKKYSGSRSDI